MSHDDSANFQLVPEAAPAIEQPMTAVGVGSSALFGFCPSELLAGYSEWTKCALLAEPSLRPETKEWLHAWRMWDLACSPMNDDERRRTRYGHYLGWHAAIKPNNQVSRTAGK
jgi:hypothetical protein